MKKEYYQDIISEISEHLTERIISKEDDLARRSRIVDKDIAEIVQEIGLQTTKKVLENIRDDIVKKKPSKA